jgi:hypothetical protein
MVALKTFYHQKTVALKTFRQEQRTMMKEINLGGKIDL